jgi:hypothetical protein
MLTKIGVLGKSEASSLARANQSCARNAQLQLENRALSTITGDMFPLTVCCLGWRPWHVQTRGCCNWWEVQPVRQFVLYEKDFGWMDFWDLNPEVWDRFGWRPFKIWGQWTPSCNYILAFTCLRGRSRFFKDRSAIGYRYLLASELRKSIWSRSSSK